LINRYQIETITGRLSHKRAESSWIRPHLLNCNKSVLIFGEGHVIDEEIVTKKYQLVQEIVRGSLRPKRWSFRS